VIEAVRTPEMLMYLYMLNGAISQKAVIFSFLIAYKDRNEIMLWSSQILAGPSGRAV
jgi:hypothetical protein